MLTPRGALGTRATRAVVGLALACAGLALLDPSVELALPGAVLGGIGLVWTRGRSRVAALLATVWALAAMAGPGMPADSWKYLLWLRSLAFDGDVDLRNEWQALEYVAAASGPPSNPTAIGPALTWSPFYAIAHVWVLVSRAAGQDLHAADGYSAPYVRAAALGTLTVLVLGAAMLQRRLAALADPATAWLATGAALLGSPVAYYALLAPGMSHGVACAAAAVVLSLWLDTHAQPSARRWVWLGAALGWLALCRWQAAVYGLLPAALALQQWREGRLRVGWLALAGAATLLALSPQLIVWRVVYGRFVTVPQGSGFMDWSSPRLLDVVLSADHGLSLTPLVLLGFAGLLLSGRAPLGLRLGGLAVVVAAAWTNGGVMDHAAGDAVGARRFAFTVPLAAVGLVELLRRAEGLVRRRPLLAPAAVLGAFVAWNLGFTQWAARGRYRETPTPLHKLAADQAGLLRGALESAAERVGGAGARALVYRMLVGEYLYQARHLDGTLNLARLPEDELAGGWSEPHRRPAGPGFRWAYSPEACLLLPFEAPIDLPLAITARAPAGTQPQTLELKMNGVTLGVAPLGSGWEVLRFQAPGRYLVPGENRLCLAFQRGLPTDSGRGVAAAVARVQLP